MGFHHVEIKNPNRLWKQIRPFFGCSMEQLITIIESGRPEERRTALSEWLQRYGYFPPSYAKNKKLEK